ncbi:nucleotidyltransferase family protein [Paenibacillus woosongensis]|uniref:Nucleotidyltransferase family protein n=1 Tax=Paenibacillus woosongensis TaxID=307580 RepID=A0AA95I4N7_9BACL|nr:nucleotidyltransferase family protein [Paenibacillus woosongensis]WHX47128.1 nucleotidyltransferase family protein [Paenibacillus woosongensis]
MNKLNELLCREEGGRDEDRVKQLIRKCEPLMQDLRTVRSLELPECYIAAGYIRGYIWDCLHGYDARFRHEDIDVVFFDPRLCSEERDAALQFRLIEETGNPRWSVKNQARMHIRNEAPPYASAADAMRRWPETATAIGVRLTDQDQLELCAPYGLGDLLCMVVRRSPLFADRPYYLERVRRKHWLEDWPLLTWNTD